MNLGCLCSEKQTTNRLQYDTLLKFTLLSYSEMSRPPTIDDFKSFPDLQEAIDEFKRYSDRITSLYERTMTCFREIVESVPTDKAEAVQSAIPFSKQEAVKRELQKSPSVFFIGERNCGKSSIVNELLRQSSLPVHENPCTARIVRIKYAEQSYARLVGSDGREVKRELFQGKHLPENLIVIKDEDRENEEALETTVEVGLKHKLLRSGIELIDSPGKSESEVLDRVLDDFLSKDTVPLFVYVINGDTRLTCSVSAMYSFACQVLGNCYVFGFSLVSLWEQLSPPPHPPPRISKFFSLSGNQAYMVC